VPAPAPERRALPDRYPGRVRRVLAPKWWLLHAFVVAAVLVMLRLGLWQWHRAESPSGGIQNYAYAMQWPLFAAFGVFLWIRTLIEEIRRDPDAEATRTAAGAAAAPPDPVIVRQPGVRIGITTHQPTDDADDPEVAAWNARLAALNARASATESRRR
jgi:DNA-binding transcriptional regulator of glucitol operon